MVAKTISKANSVAPELPHGWELKAIGEVTQVNPKCEKSAIPDNLMVSFVPMRAVGAGDGTIDVSDLRSAAEVKKGFTNFRAGDVLFAKITPCMENGKMAIVPKVASGYGFGSTEFHVLRPKDGVDPRYLYYFVSSQRVRREAAHNMTGAVGQKRVPTSFITNLEIPLASPDQQRQIVAEIEKQFSRLDKAVANLKRVKANLKRYKAAVISKMTSKTWPKRALGSLLAEPLRNGHSAKSISTGKGVPTFNLSAVTYGDFSDHNIKITSADKNRVQNLWAKYGDIFIERSNTPELVGTARLYTGEDNRAIFPDLLIRVRVNQEAAPRWVEICLQSDRLRRYFKSRAQGISGTMPKIDQQTIMDAEIPLPPISEQLRLISSADRYLSIIKETENEVESNLNRAECLRQSVLNGAFSGS